METQATLITPVAASDQPVFKCLNCANFKRMVVKVHHIKGINLNEPNKHAFHCTSKTGHIFPVSKTVIEKVMDKGSCGIYYCSKGLQGRSVYLDENEAAYNKLDDFTPIKPGPCPEYK